MDSLQIGQELQLDDGNYVLDSVQGAILGLRNSVTMERRHLDISALSSMLARPPVFNLEFPGPRKLDVSTENELKHARLIAEHLEEAMNGTPLPGSSSRAEYEVEMTTQIQRWRTKSAEMTAAGIPCTDRTLQRWAKRYAAAGLAGLLDRRADPKREPLGRLDERVKATLATVIAQETGKSTGTVGRLIQGLREELLKLYPEQNIQVPSTSTLRRHINLLTQGKYTTGNAVNRRTAANAPNRMYKSRPGIAPGHEVQVDSSPFDVLVVTGIDELTGKLTTGRANLVIMLDKATQSIIASSIRLSGVKGVDLAFMLAQCLTPRPLRPNSLTAFNELELAEMPWARFLSADEAARCDTTRPFIKPQRIMKDNGADYASAVFESACTQFGIDTTSAALHTPTDKPNVERAFHTIKTKFAQFLPGFTGGSVDRRGERPEHEDLLDVYTLAELFDRWIGIVWQNMQHESLRDPLVPSIIHSPNSMYMAMFPMTGFVPLPLVRDDYIALLPTELRTIQLDGIQVDYRRYDAPELHPYRLRKSRDNGTSGKWAVHYNPHDPSAVWIRDPETGGWIQCDWMNRDAFKKPFSASIRRNAREITTIQGALGDQASLQASIDLISQTKPARKRFEATLVRQESSRNLAVQAGTALPMPMKRTDRVENMDDENDDVQYEEFGMFDPEKGML